MAEGTSADKKGIAAAKEQVLEMLLEEIDRCLAEATQVGDSQHGTPDLTPLPEVDYLRDGIPPSMRKKCEILIGELFAERDQKRISETTSQGKPILGKHTEALSKSDPELPARNVQ